MVLFQRGLLDRHSSRETCQLCGECQQPERGGEEEKERGRDGERRRRREGEMERERDGEREREKKEGRKSRKRVKKGRRGGREVRSY